MAKQLNTRIDGDLKDRFDNHLKRSGQTMRFVVEQALQQWLDRNEDKFRPDRERELSRKSKGK